MVGTKLAERLARDGLVAGVPIAHVVLADVVEPRRPTHASFGTEVVTGDLADDGVVADLLEDRPDVIFHLAAIVSGEAEADFEKGYRVNLDGTRLLFDGDPHGRRRLPAAGRLRLLDRGLRRAVPGRDRRRILRHR